MAAQYNRYKALDHPIRRRIVQLLAEEPQTYSSLLARLDIESGHLAYHIRNLDVLIEKDENGVYCLSRDGEEAYRFLTGETKQAEPQSSPYDRVILLVVAGLILIIFGSVFIWAPSLGREEQVASLRDESTALNLEALDTVYEVFEDWEIPREHWTGLLLKIVKIRDDLDELQRLTGDPRLGELASELEEYEKELSSVVVVGDPDYVDLTVEKRYLIRGLHTLLLEIDEVLAGL